MVPPADLLPGKARAAAAAASDADALAGPVCSVPLQAPPVPSFINMLSGCSLLMGSRPSAMPAEMRGAKVRSLPAVAMAGGAGRS